MLMNRCAVAVGLALAWSLFVQDANAAVIGFWRMEPGALTVDSSGNGYTLTNVNGVASSADVAAGAIGSTGSGLFNGSNLLQTQTPLQLSGARFLRLSWWSKHTNTVVGAAGLVFETSSDFNNNPGGIIADVVEETPTTGETGIRYPSSYNLDRYTHRSGVAPAWDQYAVEMNLDATSSADIVRVFVNGALQADAAAYGLHDAVPNGFTFLNALGSIGARANGGFGLVGNIDEVKLESVPEPSSFALAIGGLVGLVALIRRRKS